MFNKVGFQMRPCNESVSSLPISSNDQTNIHPVAPIHSKSIKSWPALNGPAGIEKFASLNRSRSVSSTCQNESSIAGAHQTKNKSAENRQTLIDNLIKHLQIGSHDSLNVMKDVFKYHRYDTTLLDRYIEKRTPQNLRSLQIQLENQLFLAADLDQGKN